MTRVVVLLPLLLCLLWTGYLVWSGYQIKEGKQGYAYILIFSVVIALFYTLMLWLTH